MLVAVAGLWAGARLPAHRAPVASEEPGRPRAEEAEHAPESAVVVAERTREEPARQEHSGVHAASRESLAALPVAEVLGTVLDSAGVPLAGAEVTVFAGPLFAGEAPVVLATRASTADGRFRVAVPRAEERFGVRVRAPGHVTKSRDQSPGVDVPFELLAGVRVRGRILGAGAHAARVYHHADATGTIVRVDDGAVRYVAKELPLGRAARFEVVPGDAAPFSFELEASQPGELVHDIELGSARRVVGRVRSALDGAPIADAELSVASGVGAGRLARSDARGEFELALGGSWLAALDGLGGSAYLTIDVQAQGYFAQSVSPAWIARGGDLELVPGARLAGRVLDGEGRPAAGARLEFQGSLWQKDWNFGSLLLAPPPAVTSDAEGRFVFACVPWGREDTVLWVEHAGLRVGFGNVAPLGPRDAEERELRLPRGRGLRGQLVWEDAEYWREEPRALLAGEPPLPAPAGVRVLLRCDGRDLNETTSDARGCFAFDELPGGALELAVASEAPHWRLLREDPEGPVQLSVPAPRRLWTGTLRAADGTPLAGRELTLLLRRRARPDGPRFTERTDAQGGFLFAEPDFPGLAATLVLTQEGLELAHEGESARIDWTLPELVPVELFLPEAVDGESWSLAWTGPAPGQSGSLDRALRFFGGRHRTPLPAGELELVVRGPGGRTSNASVTIRAGTAPTLELHPR